MIDKELFPDEHRAIERLKETSKRLEGVRDKRRATKLKKIEECRKLLGECRRIVDEKHNG